MDAGDLAFLESADALMTAAVDATSEHRDPIRAVAALRRDERFAAVPAVRMATALTQARLRVAAVTKFGADADRLWFTPAGLEQATTRRVADHRAARLDGLAGPGHVLDLCCGVGADLAAFARTGRQVIGVDLDSVTAAVAAANLRALGLPGSTVVADAAEVEHASAAAVFVDPSRRSPRGRVFDPDAYRPPWSFVESLLGRDGLAAAKVAPGLDHALVPRHVEADWVSLDGDLREACLWSPAPGAARRRATVLSARSSATCTDLDLPAEPVTAHEPGRYLYEPDDAVIRAHLVGVVAARTEGWLLDPHLAYVSADRLAAVCTGEGVRGARHVAVPGAPAPRRAPLPGHRHADDQETGHRHRARRSATPAGVEGRRRRDDRADPDAPVSNLSAGAAPRSRRAGCLTPWRDR